MTDITAPLPLRARSTRKSAQNHRFGKVTTADDETTLTAIDKKQPPKPTNLYPGLNDITDAFEAFPTDLRKYFTLLKEIDAKCVQPVPELEHQIKRFQNVGNSASNIDQRNEIISAICNLLNEILPCLEEKMHVASIGADKALSFIDRINDDYDLIINKELPTSVIYGDTHHPAIMDIKVADNKSAQSQRSESRREALAARKAVSTETDNEDAGNVTSTNNNHSSTNNHTTTSTGKSKARKGGPDKEGTPVPGQTSQGGNNGNTSNTGSSNKKRKPNNSNKDKDSTTTGQSTSSKSEDPASIPRPGTPSSANKRRAGQKKKTANATAQATSTDSTTSSSQQQQHQQEHHQQQQQQNSTEKASTITPEPQEEPTYCYCDQVSYGEMVGCDGEYCQREWFHLPCIGLTTLPRGKWYCDDCKALEADKKKASKK